MTNDFEVESNPMMIVAGCAVVFNIILGLLLHGAGHVHSHGGGSHSHKHEPEDGVGGGSHSHQQHLNIRAALIHVIGDLIQSVGVLISSIIIKIYPGGYIIANKNKLSLLYVTFAKKLFFRAECLA
jgi:zinc transporter 2